MRKSSFFYSEKTPQTSSDSDIKSDENTSAILGDSGKK